MDDLCEVINGLNINEDCIAYANALLMHDINVIVACYNIEVPSIGLKWNDFSVPAAFIKHPEIHARFFQLFDDESKLFKKIYKGVWDLVPAMHLNDVFPLIDEYIEAVFFMKP